MGCVVPTEQATARLAAHLVASYGNDAARAASERAEATEKFGNSDAAEIWAAVAAVLDRRSRKARPGEA
jgi:hypothetical protein